MRELRHPRPRPARRRGADPCLRPRPRLSVQRQPRSGIGRAEAARAPPTISTGWRPRISAALSVPTAAGPLYEVDTRLRPSGSRRPARRLARQLRPLSARAGLDLGAYGAAPRAAGLRLARAAGGACGDRRARRCGRRATRRRRRRRCGADAARNRRATSRRAARSTSSSAPGGLVDLEFAVHTLQLTHRDRPRSASRGGDRGARRGRPGAAPTSTPALRLLTRMLVMFRLVAPRSRGAAAGHPAAGRRGLRLCRLGRACLRRRTRRGRGSASCGRGRG